MNKLETLLKDQPLEEPGHDLDQRMDSLFREKNAQIVHGSLTVHPWQLVVAAMLCIGIGFGLSRITQPEPQLETEAESEAEAPYTTIYFIESSLFDTAPDKQARDALFWDRTIEPVITIGETPSGLWKPEVIVIVNTKEQGELL